ncbi:SAM-dependent methyltransferase [Crenobacter sp. SG2305]|uniref:SAM-dependent methyltransferase n=1 Tax=Crenobacter oryzisoli TaxID=3056844 RepID=UPI0025AB4EED|nr:SAM-dependent methyltransferase [Crenobacter sp. SG2305]MDN0083114.1 SAM-dependent methyltransferase [Crenobacter sp. SG2305]
MRWFKPALIQLVASLLAWFWIAPATAPLAWAGLQGVLAASLACMLRERGWRLMIYAGFCPAMLGMLQLGLPNWLYLALALLLIGLARNAAFESVPFYRSSAAAVAAVAARLPENARLLEAGCADARFAMALSAERPDVIIVACENALLAWCWAWLRWWRAGQPANVRIVYASLWSLGWQEFDAVYTFLSPAPMARVWRQFQQQGRPGSLLLSNTFTVPGVAPTATLPLGGPLQQALLIWNHSYERV